MDRDPGDSSRYIRKLTKEVGETYQKQTRGQRPLIIITHSWGTVLSYAALHALRGEVAINGFISLGSPLNPSPLSLEKGFLTLETLKEFLPPGLLFNNLKKPASLKGPWFNYFAEKDLYSSPGYDWANPFSEGLAAVRIGTDQGKWKYGYIDKTGKIVVPVQVNETDKFSAGGSIWGLRDKVSPATSTRPAGISGSPHAKIGSKLKYDYSNY
jgi:pimeloyl-ACP methyl ester carboxylesterase